MDDRDAHSTAAMADAPPSAAQRLLRFHSRALREAFQRLLSTPITSFMTITVIGVALALPAALDVAIRSFSQLGQSLQQHATLSVFLKADISDAVADDIRLSLKKRPDIGAVEFISATQALQEFKVASGLGAALDNLADNPLPAALIITPASHTATKDSLQRLANELRQLPGVDAVQLDVDWVERLQAVFRIVGNVMAILSVFFVLTVVMVVANTVRLLSELHRESIHITKLVGASDGYVLRPFLYTGGLLGLAGGAVALLLVGSAIAWVAPEVNTLARLYQSTLSVQQVGWQQAATLLLAAATLGIGGAWLAAGRSLRRWE